MNPAGFVTTLSAMEGLFVYPFSPAAWIGVSGEDAGPFLQGQFSNDLNRREDRPVVYGLWLDAKGKIEGDGFVLRSDAETFDVFSYHTPAAVLYDRLERYIIADDVELSDETESMWGFAVWGESAAAYLEASGFPVPGAGEFALGESGARVMRGRRSSGGSFDVLVPAGRRTDEMARIESGLSEWDGVLADDEMYHGERIRSGIPAVMVDVGPGNLPHEGGLETEAVSYEKGCYTGQEVMARLRTKGRVRRRLVRVEPARLPETMPYPLYAGDRQAGRLTSWGGRGADRVGFALADVSALANANGLSLEPDGDPCIRVLDFERGDGS